MERDWSDLPRDVMAMILPRVGVIDILENAQKVCKDWFQVCDDPFIWKAIYMYAFCSRNGTQRLREMTKRVIEKSNGELVDITFGGYISDEPLMYVADRSSKLRRLKLLSCVFGYTLHSSHKGWTKVLKKFPLLEELNIESTTITRKDIEGIGRYCPFLKTLKFNRPRLWNDTEVDILNCDIMAKDISQNLGELRHLELIGNGLSNKGLELILNGCRHLVSLDLSQCLNIDLKGQLGTRCAKQIKYLKVPNGSIESY